MPRIRLICWNAVETAEKAARLRAAGYGVASEPLTPAGLRALRVHPPAAAVIDLARLPSQGRDVALAIRRYKATRRVPLIFVDGNPDKVARTRDLLPDATYTTWSRVRTSLKQAIAHPPADPIVPGSVMAGYAGTPLPKKLGIKASSVVGLVDAPPGFEKTLGRLPEGVTLRMQARGRPGLTLWFARSRKDLERRIKRMVPFAENGGLWIVWPKKASRIASDLSETTVRGAGLAAGLVDFKVCAVDTTWSGLRFTRAKSR